MSQNKKPWMYLTANGWSESVAIHAWKYYQGEYDIRMLKIAVPKHADEIIRMR